MSIRRAQDERIEGTPDGLNAITEIMDVPDAPTIGTATDNGSLGASVTFTPATTGGTATTYTVTSTPGSFTGTGASSPVTVSGLNAGTSYTFKVKGTNSAGVIGPESSASNSMAPAFPVIGAYDSLATVNVGVGGVSSITFSGITTEYKHLQLRILAKWGTAYTAYSRIQFNGDTSTNYAQHRLEGYGASASSAGYTGETSGILGINSDTQWGLSVTDILDYSNPNKYTTVRTLGGYDNNGSGGISLSSSLWRSTSQVTSIVILPSNGVTFVENSSFQLYGVK